MGELFRLKAVTIAVTVLGSTAALAPAFAQSSPPASDPPSRVGRLAFTQGTVSFHDDQQKGWTQALVNTPLTSGDSVWTEPNAHGELSVAGSRVRMDGATQLDLLALDDSQTRLQLDEGRVDIKTFDLDTHEPYQIVTPRGTVSLLQKGDYYVEAGSTQDATRLGVRAGAAQIQSLNGQVVAVRPGEVAEVVGDATSPQLRTIDAAPPAPPAYWAQRDQQVSYDPPQYVPVGMTGYEDLNAYGNWVNDGSYGQVWVPRSVPAGWEPYRTGRWDYVQPWGWTWVDDQPWGFAPYHYGRWANANGRWMWVPPERNARPVYAPALVAFVGGAALASALTHQTSAPIGWVPLGPREAYIPPYSNDRNYYRRINQSARVEDRVLEERWQQAERREAPPAHQPPSDPQRNPAGLMNQRFATVVPTSTFVRSQPVAHAALQVTPDKIAATPVAARPTLEARPADVQRPPAPGPKVAATAPRAATEGGRPNLPPLSPRMGAAPPEVKGTATPVAPQAIAKPAEAPRLQQIQPQAIPPMPPPAGQARPADPPHAQQERPQQQAPRPQATPPAATQPQQHPQAEQHQAEPQRPTQQHQPEQQRPSLTPAAPAPRPREMQEGARPQPLQVPQQARSQPQPQPQQQHAAPQAQPGPQPQQQQAAHPQPASPQPQPQQHAAPPQQQPHPQPAPGHQEQAQAPEHKK